MNWKRKTDAQVLEILGTRIKERRQQKRYTQEDLAQKAGISTNTLQKIEYGQNPTMTSFIQVLRALDEMEQLEQFLPPVQIRPMEMLLNEEKTVYRVRKPRKKS